MTITEFLEARIAEDEAAIDRRGSYPHSWHGTDVAGSYNPQCPDCIGVAGRERVLAECAAKRFILTMHQTYARVAAERTGIQAFGAECGREVTGDVLKPLAAVYASHPDYRQEWAL